MVSRRFRQNVGITDDGGGDSYDDSGGHAIDFDGGDETKVVKVNPCYQARPLLFKTAAFDYEAAEEGELEMKAGDKIVILEAMDENWGKGKNERTGQVGLYPIDYVS